MITNYAKNKIALFIAGSTTAYPLYFAIGSGSGTTSATDTSLVYPVDGQAFTSTNGSIPQKVSWQGDWSSNEMSGIQLREFGTKVESGTTGSVWSKTNFPALTFDGTNELRIEETWEVY